MFFDTYNTNTSIISDEVEVKSISTESASLGAVALDRTSIATCTTTNALIHSNVNVGAAQFVNLECSGTSISQLNSGEIKFEELSNITNLSGTTLSAENITIQVLNCDSFNAPQDCIFNSVETNDINASEINAITVTSANINCTSLSTDKITADSITSDVFNSNETTTIDYQATVPSAFNGAILRASTFKNGQIDTIANYKVVNNAVSTFSDLQLLNGAEGSNKIYIYGYDVDSDSLPIISTANNQLGAFDNQSGFGGTPVVMSLTNNSGSTLRYEQTGNLTIYSDPNTITWQTTLMVSDIRDKTDIEALDSDAAFFLNPVYFEYRDDDIRRAGFIAQELENLVPESILKPNVEEPYLSVQMEKIIPYLVNSINLLL